MYHTFQASQTADGKDIADNGRPSNSRRVTISNACGSCRKRKIRCDGSLPCGPCVYYQQADACIYQKPGQRVSQSRKMVDKLSSTMEQHQAIFNRLFPGKDVRQMVSLSREELIAAIQLTEAVDSTDRFSDSAGSELPRESGGVDSLETLIQAPEQDPALDEATRHQVKVQGISDDVNGLSLSLARPSSYVGVSSITAAIKVICRVAPMTPKLLVAGQIETAMPSRAGSPSPDLSDLDPTYLPPADIGQVLIEAYFQNVHPLMPMLDEQRFWHTWLYGERRDSPWLALVNTVLALGSVVSSDCHNNYHRVYFRRAMQLLDINSLGSANTLVVQTLGLLSGYYLHYVNRPNLANNLMGATLRQATVLGLHREYADKVSPDGSPAVESMSAEVRRRTWWSLYVLDVWANTTTGRPSLGQLGGGITARLPTISDVKDQASAKLLPLLHNVEFCKISAQIQDALSATPLLKFDQLRKLDEALLKWHAGLPALLQPSFAQQDSRSVHDVLKTPRMIMYWRYQNIRLLLHRPYLLATSLRRVPDTSLSPEEKVGVGRCRAIAARTIADISTMCAEELLAGWNAVWFMYQATMVPLISIFAALSNPIPSTAAKQDVTGKSTSPQSSNGRESLDTESIQNGATALQEWQNQVEQALRFFDRMDRWSVTAKKSRDVVSRLYEASKQLASLGMTSKISAPGQLARPNVSLQQSFPVRADDRGLTDDTQASNTYSSDTTGYNNFQGTTFAPVTDMITENIWGLSPNGTAAMNNFWFDDMMWDVPAADSQMLDMSGNDFAYSELDWLSILGMQNDNEQTDLSQ